jgi:hypothetical protein
MDELSALRTGLGTTTKTRTSASKTPSETDDKNQIKNRFISSHAFHRTPAGRIRKIIAGVQFELGILKSFGPVTQESYREHPATILNKIDNSKSTAHD